MSPRSKQFGHVKTFSRTLGSGTVAVIVDGELKSLAFRADAIAEDIEIGSGDTVTVSLVKRTKAMGGGLTVKSIEQSATSAPAHSRPTVAETIVVTKGDRFEDRKFQVVMPRGQKDMHFSRKAFIESGSRFDFEP